MPIRRLVLLTAALLAATPAIAQPEDAPLDTPPPALLAQFIADARAEDDSDFLDLDSVAVPVRVSDRKDLNGDGRDEVFLSAIGRFCGATGNCPLWIYQELPRGGWRRLYGGGGLPIELLDTRTNGYPDLVTPQHFSAFETYLTYDAFDGERYVWSGTALEAHDGEDDPSPGVFEVRSPLPAAARAPRAIHLLPFTVDTALGIRLSAEYTTCGAERIPGCGEARMILTGPDLGAAHQCFALHTAQVDKALAQRGETVCSEMNARGAMLQPSRAQWEAVIFAQEVELRSGTLIVRLGEYTRDALQYLWYGIGEAEGRGRPFPEH